MPNTDWWTGRAGPEKGKRLTWQRIQPGYYRLRGTSLTCEAPACFGAAWW